MGAQLSLKAALPLGGILATASGRCSKTGPRAATMTTFMYLCSGSVFTAIALYQFNSYWTIAFIWCLGHIWFGVSQLRKFAHFGTNAVKVWEKFKYLIQGNALQFAIYKISSTVFSLLFVGLVELGVVDRSWSHRFLMKLLVIIAVTLNVDPCGQRCLGKTLILYEIRHHAGTSCSLCVQYNITVPHIRPIYVQTSSLQWRHMSNITFQIIVTRLFPEKMHKLINKENIKALHNCTF